MCWADNCCYFVSIQQGTIFIGFSSLILSMISALASIVLLILNDTHESLHTYYMHQILHWNVAEISLAIILWIIIIFSVLWVVASLLLLVGLRMNKPSFVLTYFSFGILATILFLMTALLELLQGYWIVPMIQLIISMVYIHCLVVVHTAYDMMVDGKHMGTNIRRNLDECPIMDYPIED